MGDFFSAPPPPAVGHQGQALEPSNERSRAAQSYALLSVSPFTISKTGDIDWEDSNLAARILRGPLALLPQNEQALERRLDASSKRARHTARRSLTWDGARYSVTYEIDLYDGQRLWVEERGQRISGEGKTPHHIAAVLCDIGDRKKAEQEAVFGAWNDTMTGVWNAARIRSSLVFLQAACRDFNLPSVFLRFRISNLPDINSTHGYDTGDRLIKNVAQRLTSIFNPPNLTARIGGVSFAVGIMGCASQDVEARAKEVLEHLSGTPYASPHGDLYAEFTASSVSMLPDSGHDVDALFTQSKAAMRHAIATGKKYEAYSAPLHNISQIKTRSETTSDDIIAALNDRRISLAYQPIVDAKTRSLHHYECLLRLKRDDGEIVSAGAFVMAAERLGLVHLLDRRALEIASETVLRHPDIELALNVSAATVKSLETASSYLEALRTLGPATSRITLELTETVALEDPAMASRFSVEARMLGCQFSIDDFGSGHTTFQNLMAIEADSIKIDGSFVKDLSLMPHKQTFVRMMVDLAQTFSVKTVAEMVETREDAELLERLGVDYLQGYFFGVPSAAPAWQKTHG